MGVDRTLVQGPARDPRMSKTRIERWGAWLAFLSWLPLVGDLFALGLGFYKVNAWQVALFMLIGKTARFVGWAVAVEWIRPLVFA